MAYEKQTWVTGEVITKEKLNHMEDGIADSGGSGVFIANLDMETHSLDKTWNEINTAVTNRQPCYVKPIVGEDSNFMLPLLGSSVFNDNEYLVVVLFAQGATVTTMNLTTDNPDGYPSDSGQ